MPASKTQKNANPKSASAKGKKAHPSNTTTAVTQTSQSNLSFQAQQRTLDVFRKAFHSRLATDIKPLLQEVKHHLYNRDFAEAFGRDDYLEAYAARWSPSRALGYVQVLRDIEKYIDVGHMDEDAQPWKIVSLGGGAGAEIVALSYFHAIHQSNTRNPSPSTKEVVGNVESKVRSLELHAVDIAAWQSVLGQLYAVLTSAIPKPVLSSQEFQYHFHQKDILKMTRDDLTPLLISASLITIFFTLNELYSTSISATQLFLLTVTTLTSPGTQLLVVDSPGSYSTVKLGKEGAEKQYPMQWLLEHTLLRSADGEDGEPNWERVASDNSVWFRLSEETKYPISLENMRYQVHLYQRL